MPPPVASRFSSRSRPRAATAIPFAATAGTTPPASPLGTVEDLAFFPYLCAAAPTDDWLDPKTWAKANPSLGVTLDLEDFARDVQAARISPGDETSFRRYRNTNQWLEAAEEAWISTDRWDSRPDPLRRRRA